jgi:aquaporin Z
MYKYLTEFIGTFFLVLTVCMMVSAGNQAFAPLAIGLSLMIMVYAGGHISGGHYNPAVSLAAMMSGALPKSEFVPYIVAQTAGAIVASLIALVVTGRTIAPAPGAGGSDMSSLIVEAVYTFLLAYTVLNVAVSKKTQGNSYFGAAIGMSITVAAYSGGALSGGAFNPAVGLGTTIMHATMGDGVWSHVWLYIVGPFAGAAVAAIVFGFQEKGEG